MHKRKPESLGLHTGTADRFNVECSKFGQRKQPAFVSQHTRIEKNEKISFSFVLETKLVVIV